MIAGTTEINEKKTYHFSLMSDTQHEHYTSCGLHLSVETFKPTDFTEIMVHQWFCQTVPLRESHVAFREGPQKNGERANLALYFYKAACRLNPGIV